MWRRQGSTAVAEHVELGGGTCWAAAAERAGRRRRHVDLLHHFLLYCECGTPSGEEPLEMAHPITIDPNPMPGRTGDDAAFQPVMMGVFGVVFILNKRSATRLFGHFLSMISTSNSCSKRIH